MKLSAHNQIKGKVADVQKGQTTAHVRIDIGNGVVITSSITNEAIDEKWDNAAAVGSNGKEFPETRLVSAFHYRGCDDLRESASAPQMTGDPMPVSALLQFRPFGCAER